MSYLASYLSVSVHDRRRLRDADTFISRTYSVERQVEELIDHLFVQYPVPVFLYRTILNPGGRELVRREARVVAYRKDRKALVDWEQSLFMAAAQGRSVAKLLSGQLTKKEVHFFLQAPDHYDARTNLLWAQLTAAGVKAPTRELLMERLKDGPALDRLGDRRADLVRFFARYGAQMTAAIRQSILDFAMAMVNVRGFSFAGRTLGSMTKLSREWHRQNKWGSSRVYRSWPSAIEAWEVKTPKLWVRAAELTNSQALHEESLRQNHCVFTYLPMCLSGSVRIVRLSWIHDLASGPVEASRVTIEVCPAHKQVMQALGRSNRSLSEDERRVVRQWARARGLELSEYVWW